ncbi:methyltransferase [Gordonia phage Margaret]|nr:methyltransferase [Gordonia phage Margaret]
MTHVLNLYAGVGGNRQRWRGGHVTAVEYDRNIARAYKRRFPQDTVICADAHQYLLDHYREFDAIWSSPPCPSHSRMRTTHSTKGTKPVYPDMKLYEEIIFLRHFVKVPWVVENVIPYYKPLIEPSRIISRHTFWSNRWIAPKHFPPLYSGQLAALTVAEMQDIYEIDLPAGGGFSRRKVLRNMVFPELGRYVMGEILKERY